MAPILYGKVKYESRLCEYSQSTHDWTVPCDHVIVDWFIPTPIQANAYAGPHYIPSMSVLRPCYGKLYDSVVRKKLLSQNSFPGGGEGYEYILWLTAPVARTRKNKDVILRIFLLYDSFVPTKWMDVAMNEAKAEGRGRDAWGAPFPLLSYRNGRERTDIWRITLVN